jgi:hypothetical protein
MGFRREGLIQTAVMGSWIVQKGRSAEAGWLFAVEAGRGCLEHDRRSRFIVWWYAMRLALEERLPRQKIADSKLIDQIAVRTLVISGEKID